MLKQADSWAPFPIEMVDLQLRHDEADEISLSWHLTAVEKTQVLNAIRSTENQTAFARLKEHVSRCSLPNKCPVIAYQAFHRIRERRAERKTVLGQTWAEQITEPVGHGAYRNHFRARTTCEEA